MTINHSLKQLIRARMRVTGETYTQARRAVLRPHSSYGVPAFDSFLSHDEFQRFEALFASPTNSSVPKSGLHLFVSGTGNGKTTALKSLADYYESKYPYLRTLVLGESYDFVKSDTRLQIDTRPSQDWVSYNTTAEYEHNRRLLHSAVRMRADVILYDTLNPYVEGAVKLANVGSTVGMTFHSDSEQSAIQHLYERVVDDSKRPQHALSEIASALQSITTMHHRVVDGVRIAITANTPMTAEGVDAALSGKYEQWSEEQGHVTSSAKLRMVEQFRKAN